MLRDLRVLDQVGSLVGLTDRQLLERFRAASSEGDQAAAEASLTALVERHAAMVWNLCRSLVRDRHDTEDAFQATFLILVRKAGHLRVGETLGPWLHVVAYRTALSARTSAARRRQVERTAAKSGEAVEVPEVGDGLHAAIHAEIMGLPEPFRAAVVLCDLEGLSYLEAAGRLKIPMGTLQSRLARARRRLRRGLTMRGIRPADADGSTHPLGIPVFASLPNGGPPASVVGRVGSLVASDPGCWTTSVAGPVRGLIEGGLRSMFLGKVQRVLISIIGGILVGGTVLYAAAGSGQAVHDERRPAPKVESRRSIEIPAPSRLAVASGSGTTVVYRRDASGKRAPLEGRKKDGPFQEAERDIRWVVVTGVMENHKVQKALIVADRKPPPSARELYARVELQRQTRRAEDSWSAWEKVDAKATLDILDNVPEAEAERVPEPFRMIELVDLLPALKRGEWRGVDVEDLVPPGPGANEREPVAPISRKEARRDGPDVLMVRSLDLAVEAGLTYRYRARVVLFNPRYGRQDRRKFLSGPWSGPTASVTVPAP